MRQNRISRHGNVSNCYEALDTVYGQKGCCTPEGYFDFQKAVIRTQQEIDNIS